MSNRREPVGRAVRPGVRHLWPRPEARYPSALLNSRTTLALCALALVLLAAPASAEPKAPAYLLVIDHSSSMRDAGANGEPRWLTMRTSADTFLADVPLGSYVGIALFSDRVRPREFTISSEASRSAVRAYLQSAYERPTVAQTALYRATAGALDAAEYLNAESPGRPISIMLYTDGENYLKSGNRAIWGAGNDPNAEFTADGRRSLCHKLASFLAEHRSARVYVTPIAGAPQVLPDVCGRMIPGSVKIPVPVSVEPGRVVLKHPREAATSQIQLTTHVEASALERLASKRVSVTLKPHPGLGEVTVSPDHFELKPGTQTVQLSLTVTDTSRLAPTAQYGAVLHLIYPKDDRSFGQGPDQIEIEYKDQALAIFRLLPSPTRRIVAVGQPVAFSVETLQQATVNWTEAAGAHGGGWEGTGHSTSHAFETPGVREIQVTASLDGRTVQEKFQLDVRKAEITLSKPGRSFEGRPMTLSASGDGFDAFSWFIDGDPVEGTGPKNATLETAPGHAGEVLVRVKGVHTQLSVPVFAETRVAVEKKPTVSLNVVGSGHKNASAYQYDTNLTFEAEVGGPIKTVKWIVTPNTGAESTLGPVDVAGGKAVKGHRVAESSGVTKLTVKATGQVDGAGGFEVSSSPIEFALSAGARSVSIASPPGGAVFTYGDTLALEAAVVGPKVTGVQWTVTADGERIGSGRSDVSDGKASYSVVLETRPADAVIEVTAQLELPADVNVAQPPQATAQCTVQHAAVQAELVVAAEARWNKPHTFEAKCTPACETVTWDFGDGQQAEGGAAQHTYTEYGSYEVTAELLAPGDKTATQRATVVVSKRAPKAGFEVHHDGEVKSTVPTEAALTLHDLSEGDVASVRYLVDGEPVPPDQSTISFDQEGTFQVVQVVTGPDGTEDRAEQSVLVAETHLATALVLALLALLVFIVIVVIFSFNHPARYRLQTGKTEADAKGSGARRRRLKRLWKKAQRPPKSLILPIGKVVASAGAEYWQGDDGKDLFLDIKRIPGNKRKYGRVDLFREQNRLTDVDFEKCGDDEKTWRLRDRRPKDHAEVLFVHLNDRHGADLDGKEIAIKVIALAALLAAWWFIYQNVYLG